MSNVAALKALARPRSLWTNRRRPRQLVKVETHPRLEVHHTGVPRHYLARSAEEVLLDIENDHIGRGWNGIFYTALIWLDGVLWEAREFGWRSIGDHGPRYRDGTPVNPAAATILLPGDYRTNKVTREQKATLQRLRLEVPDPTMQYHGGRDVTACPGTDAIMVIEAMNLEPPRREDGTVERREVAVGHDSFGQWYYLTTEKAVPITAEASNVLRFLGVPSVPAALVDAGLHQRDGWLTIERRVG